MKDGSDARRPMRKFHSRFLFRVAQVPSPRNGSFSQSRGLEAEAETDELPAVKSSFDSVFSRFGLSQSSGRVHQHGLARRARNASHHHLRNPCTVPDKSEHEGSQFGRRLQHRNRKTHPQRQRDHQQHGTIPHYHISFNIRFVEFKLKSQLMEPTPDGHRAPIAELFRSSSFRSVNTQTPVKSCSANSSSGKHSIDQ